MRLVVFNGSPKKGANNTDVMLNHFLAGFAETAGNSHEVVKLDSLESPQKAVEIFKRSDAVLIAFPLYIYSLPAGLVQFVEALAPLRGACGGKSLGFLVQYGFREAVHARPLEQYLERLAADLKCTYLGTIIKGGCAGVAKNPEKQNRDILTGIKRIGRVFGANGKFDKVLLADYSKPESQVFLSKLITRIFVKLANKFYWDVQLKKNNALDKVYARPYAK